MCFQYYMSPSSYASVFWSCTSTHISIRYKYLWTVTGCVSGVCNFAKVILKQKISDNFFLRLPVNGTKHIYSYD